MKIKYMYVFIYYFCLSVKIESTEQWSFYQWITFNCTLISCISTNETALNFTVEEEF